MHAESVGSFILVDSLADFIFGCQTGDTDCISCSRITAAFGVGRGRGVLAHSDVFHAANCFRISIGRRNWNSFGSLDVNVALPVRPFPSDCQYYKSNPSGFFYIACFGLD